MEEKRFCVFLMISIGDQLWWGPFHHSAEATKSLETRVWLWSFPVFFILSIFVHGIGMKKVPRQRDVHFTLLQL